MPDLTLSARVHKSVGVSIYKISEAKDRGVDKAIRATTSSASADREVHGKGLLRRHPNLQKRIDSDQIVNILNDPSTTYVGNDDTKHRPFTDPGPHYIGTSGLDGCVGVIINSKRVAILGHYLPQTQSITLNKATDLTAKINSQRMNLDWCTAYVVAPASNGYWDYGWQKDQFVKLISDELGLTAEVIQYQQTGIMLNDNSAVEQGNVAESNAALGSILIYNAGGGTSTSEIYIESSTQ